MSSTSIWNSIEVYCASRDFGYDQYLSVHTMSGIKAAPLSNSAYAAVSDVIHASIKDDVAPMTYEHHYASAVDNPHCTEALGCSNCIPLPKTGFTMWQCAHCLTIWRRK